MIQSFRSLTLALSAVAVALPGAVLAQEMKFAIEEIEGSVQDAYAQQFKELVESQSDMSVTVYPYGALGTSQDLTELTASGVLQCTNASPGHLGALVPEIQVFSVPYLLSDNNAVNKQVLTESEVIHETLAGKLQEKGLELMAMYPEGAQVWTTNKEIRKPEDFANFKMRVMTSPMLTAAYQAFGANPTPMPYSEVYGGLQLKMIDGQVNPIFAIEEMKFYEVQDYLIFAGQQQFTTTVVCSADWFSSLPEDQQQMLQQAFSQANDYIFEVQEQYNQERLAKIKEEKPNIKIIELTPEERAAFEERAQEVRKMYVDMAGEEGKQILENLEQEIKAAEEQVGGQTQG
ncbi:MAG: TRAP transporter substrate-binding protein DctP [Candidatus Competibacteraceae bacterium]|nr:TRAP transporter substrate-binding protein DctP [Candidatus Competibacteraceae bacterium]